MKTLTHSLLLSLSRRMRGAVMLLLVGLLASVATAAQAAGWRIQIIDSGGDVGRFNTIVLDTGNRPHISYHDDTNRDLKYAHWLSLSKPTLSSCRPHTITTRIWP